MQFAHEPDARRYTLHKGEELVSVLDYRINGGSISFHHTYTSPRHRGQGYAAQLVEFAVNDVESQGRFQVVPMCWYVDEWFTEHPERSAVLSR